MPLGDSRKRPHSDLQDTYAGPDEFMEPGVRGFLVSTLPDHEELALDQALRMLRKASVKLHGGIKPVKNTTAMFSMGYIALDFVDPDSITSFPNPDATNLQDDEAHQGGENKPDKENIVDVKEGEEPVNNKSKEETEDKEQTEEPPSKDTPEEEKHEIEDVKEEEMEEDIEGKEATDAEITKDKPEEEEKSKSEHQDDKDAKDKKKETSKDDSKKDDKQKENGDKVKSDKEKFKADGGGKGNRTYKTRREKKATPKWPIMKPIYKFKAYRTEFRNVMFIKSNVPEPMAVAGEIMDLILKLKPLRADAINQLLPVLGICNYDYWELEVMARRVLAPLFSEDQEESPSFGVLVLDKFSDPGTDSLAEIIRSAVWSLNPMAWQNNPLGEPDVTIQIELIGSKIVLSAMAGYMKYRQYAPFCLSELGEGFPEDPENSERRPNEWERERFDSRRFDRRRRSRSPKSKRNDDKSASSDKDKDKSAKSKEEDKNKADKTDPKMKQEGSDQEKGELKEDKESNSKLDVADVEVVNEENTKEEEESKVMEFEDTTEETDDKNEAKKSPQKRVGRRSSSRRKT